MTDSLDVSARAERPLWRKVLKGLGPPPVAARWLRRNLPRRLFPRSILIIVLPMIALQSVVALVFMDRHWENMTRRLSDATAAEVATVAMLVEDARTEAEREEILGVARRNFFESVHLIDAGGLPAPRDAPLFSLLDDTLTRSLETALPLPFWIDTVESARFVEIRVKLDDGVLRIVTRRSRTYASNSHITLVWMVGTSAILIALSILFLRNQIRPIQQLAVVAERFGRGQPVGAYRPYGAVEVRQAGWAFIEMKERIERQIGQRTTMLAGVSHDLRTMLTRFRLELEMLDGPEVEALRRDCAAMQAMVEDYLAFAKTEIDEHVDAVDAAALVSDTVSALDRNGAAVDVRTAGPLMASLRPNAFRRMVTNLVANAMNYGTRIVVTAQRSGDWLNVTVDDDGPGIPEELRESAFRPFYRIDHARNQNVAGTGLGLTIARDIARKHGGDLVLTTSPLGGLRAEVTLPL